jgi:hypothetical protein
MSEKALSMHIFELTDMATRTESSDYTVGERPRELLASGFHAERDVSLIHRAMALAQTQLQQREMRKVFHARQFKRLARAMDGAAVNDKDAIRLFRNRNEMLHSPADASQARHYTHPRWRASVPSKHHSFPHSLDRLGECGFDARQTVILFAEI